MRWAEHSAVWGRREMHKMFLCRNWNEGDHLEDPDVDDRIVLKLILNKSDKGRTGLHLFCSGYGQVVGCSEQDN